MADPAVKTAFEEFIKNKAVAVISTVSATSQPMSATIYYVADEEYHFYFMTKGFTRKSKNLEHNQEVSLVIGAENVPVTAQIQGRAERVEDSKEFNKGMDALVHKFAGNPFIAPLFQLQGERNEILIYKITPTWIRWLDLRNSHDGNGGFVQILPQA